MLVFESFTKSIFVLAGSCYIHDAMAIVYFAYFTSNAWKPVYFDEDSGYCEWIDDFGVCNGWPEFDD